MNMEAAIDVLSSDFRVQPSIPASARVSPGVSARGERRSILDSAGLTRHTAMFRPAIGQSPAWEHHIQTLALGGGRYQITSYTGRQGTRLRMHKQAGGAVSEDVADTLHDELACRHLEQDLLPLATSAVVDLQMRLSMHRLGNRSAYFTFAGSPASLDKLLQVCGKLDDDQQAQLAAAKSRALIANIARRGHELSVSAVSNDEACIAAIIDSARADIAIKGFNLRLEKPLAEIGVLLR